MTTKEMIKELKNILDDVMVICNPRNTYEDICVVRTSLIWDLIDKLDEELESNEN